MLQDDLNAASRWCKSNKLFFNTNKCKVMTFCRKRSQISFQYSIDLTVLQNVPTMTDLGVTMDNKLSFNAHIDGTISRAMARLGFIIRCGQEFRDPYVAKALYVSLARSVLEYASVIWAPYYEVHKKRIESIQKKFLRYALRGLGWNDEVRLPPYLSRLKLINQPVNVRRQT